MAEFYYVDNEKITFQNLIKMAKSFGYHEPSGIYLTSRAVKILRENGFKVSDTKEELVENP